MKWYKTSERLPKDRQSVLVMNLDEHGDIDGDPSPSTFQDSAYGSRWSILSEPDDQFDGWDELSAWTRWRARK